MNQIHPNASLVPLLQLQVASDVKIKLYTNDLTPGVGTVLGDFTEQGSGTGYAAITVAAADFSLTGVSGNIGTVQASPVTFTASGGAWTVYGYYVTNTGNDKLLAAARFDGAPITVPDGGTRVVVPIFSLQSRYTS